MKKNYFLAFGISGFLGIMTANAQCSYNNVLVAQGAVPTVLNNSVTAADIFGGEMVRAQGMVAGNTYRVSTCSDFTFDSQLTIYPAGGGSFLAFDDDGCIGTGGPSIIEFTPAASGDYDILLDEWDCVDNQIGMDVTVTLIDDNGGGGGGNDPTVGAVIVIPVVVHVISKNATEDISDAQIQSQIDALNKDYRKMNPDTTLIPGAFQGLGSDFQIAFCLADRDPGGGQTTGITRTQTTVNEFDQTNQMKDDATGGHDNWDPQHYLNFWCCNLGGGLLGYAQFPADLAAQSATDGVVISYKFFGTVNVNSPFDLGRTATHEVGHWLNLRHIWGDAQCGSDTVNDTPTQEAPNFGCPTFPHVTCNNGPNGDMFMNYMDYVNDACMQMFSNGQKTRAHAALNTLRSQLFQSQGCSTVGIDENNLQKLTLVYPNPATSTITVDCFTGREITVRMFDLMGQEVAFATGSSRYSMNVSFLAKGVYMLNISDGSNTAVKKVILD